MNNYTPVDMTAICICKHTTNVDEKITVGKEYHVCEYDYSNPETKMHMCIIDDENRKTWVWDVDFRIKDN
jgi:hypothetical protein